MNLRFSRSWSFRRDVAGAALHWSGLGRGYELLAKPAGAIILMYHSIAEADAAQYIEPRSRMSPALFERQLRFLAEHRRVTQLSRVVAQIASGESPAAGTVCITFDDGYLDNLTVAAPILDKYRMPATLYLPTRYVDKGQPQWADVLHSAFQFRASDRLSLPVAGVPNANLASQTEQAAARKALHKYLLEASYDERERCLADLERQLAPACKPPRLMMTWDDVRDLRRRYPSFDIGGHTRDHTDLRKHRGARAEAQILGCAADLRRELGIEPQHFSFPYERWCGETKDVVARSGWTSAVGAGDDFRIVATSDRFAMPRVESPHFMTGFRFKTSGAFPGALSAFGLM